MTASTLPPIADKGRRVLRTVVQTALAFVSLAAYVPVIEPLFGAPHSSNLAEYAAGAGVWITGTAAIITGVMAIPAVDRRLTVLGIGSVAPSRVQIVVREAAETAREVLDVAAPVLKAVEPKVAPEIQSLEDIVDTLADAPVPAAEPAPLTVSTGTLAVATPAPTAGA